MPKQNRYEASSSILRLSPNIWDIIVATIVIGILFALSSKTGDMALPYQIGQPLEISLEPKVLPGYALSTILRMSIALFFSIIFTLIVAPIAAKSYRAERLIIPAIDILQSIPVLGVLSVTVVGFIKLFPNSLLGPECAAIFAIFTSQVWNMVLSLYQSLRQVPKDLHEAANIFHLSAWQKFWRIELPHGTPLLLWNTMVSISAGWFFIVYSEAISVSNQEIILPGLGSYINKAILETNYQAIIYAIITMFIIILLYDQLIFRPLLAWCEKFKAEIDDEDTIYESWFFDLLAKTKLLKKLALAIDFCNELFINGYQIFTPAKRKSRNLSRFTSIISPFVWNLAILVILCYAIYSLCYSVYQEVPPSEIIYVMKLGLITAIKVVILIIVASIIWIPIGVWIGLNPTARRISQPLIQFLAAFPANLFYPLAVIFILKFDLNKNIWTMPLMILGTQWYILFNVIGGAAGIPKEIRLATENFGVKGWLWWRKLILPAIFPSYVTGAMTAAGGCWNASIVAEFVQWGDTTIESIGLGYYITEFTRAGDFPRITLGIAAMCLYVVLFNRLVWQKLYDFAQARFSLV